MTLNKKTNKIKISCFGNPWIVRILKSIRYLGVALIAWKFWVSENFFSKQPPLLIIKSLWKWENATFDNLSNIILTLVFILSILFTYLYLSGKLIKWLSELKISPQQQIDIFHGIYRLDEKESYSVKIEELKKVSYRGSPHACLKGNLILENKGKIKKLNSSCYSSFNAFDSYLANANVTYEEKSFFTLKMIVFLMILTLNGFYVGRIYYRSRSLSKESPHPLTLKEILSSATAGRLKAQREAEEKQKKEIETLQAKISQGAVVSSSKINIRPGDVGGNEEAKKISLLNAKIISQKNNGLSTPYEPFNMLLFGPPGTGKTMLAKLIAKESGSYFVNLTGDRFKGPDAGKRMRECLDSASEAVINLAKKEGKEKDFYYTVVFIDEVDKCEEKEKEKFFGWGEGGSAGSFLLPILDGIEKWGKVRFVFVFTTNYPEKLTTALFRSGRIDEQICVFYPQPNELSDIIKKSLGNFYEKNNSLHPYLFDTSVSTKSTFISKFGTAILKEMLDKKYSITFKDVINDPVSLQLAERAGMEKISLFTGADVERVVNAAPNAILEREEKRGRSLIEEDFTRSIQKAFENMIARGFTFEKFVDQLFRKYLKVDDIYKKVKNKRQPPQA